jgi:hypothetical protein
MRSNEGSLMGRLAGACVLLLALAACGGGGGGSGEAPAPAPAPLPAPVSDARNGDYVAVAANAREYSLHLDFDARTFRISGTGLEQSGAIGSDASGLFFQTSGSSATAVNTARFSQANDTVIGGLRFPEGVLPFIAPRVFVDRLADAAGVYNVLTRTVDTAAAPDNTIFEAELTAAGQLRTCNDLQIFPIATCPDSSVTSGTVTLAGNVFTSTTPTGAFAFRIARIGADKVLLRASPSSATARRFWVGVPAASVFASGSFAGANTDGNWSAFALSSSAHVANITTPAGTFLVRSGEARPEGTDRLGNLLRLTTANSGSYFAIRSGELAVVSSSLGSTTAPGFLEIGRRQ